MANVAEVKSRGATVVLVANDGDEETARQADAVLWVPETHVPVRPHRRRGAPAAVRLRAGPAARPRRRPAPQPGQGGHRRVTARLTGGRCPAWRHRQSVTGTVGVAGVGVDAVDVDRFRGPLGRRPRWPDGCSPAASGPTPCARHRPGAAPGHPVRRQGGDHEGARRRARRRSRFHEVEVVRSGSTLAVLVAARRRRRRWPASAGVVRWHLSLTHTDSVAMAVRGGRGGGTRSSPTGGDAVASVRCSPSSPSPRCRPSTPPPRPPPRSTCWSSGPAPRWPVAALEHAGRRLRAPGGGGGRARATTGPTAGWRAGLPAGGGPGSRVVERRVGRGRSPAADLVIDAAYGTGFRGEYRAPTVPDRAPRCWPWTSPRGSTGDTGEAPGTVLAADRTVTFAALKPGLLQGDGRRLAGRVERGRHRAADQGARARLVGGRRRDRPGARPTARDGNKWRRPCWWWPARRA